MGIPGQNDGQNLASCYKLITFAHRRPETYHPSSEHSVKFRGIAMGY